MRSGSRRPATLRHSAGAGYGPSGAGDPAATPRPGRPAPGRTARRATLAFTVGATLLSATVVASAGGGEAFWLSLPIAMLAAATAPTRLAAALGATATTAAALAAASRTTLPASIPVAVLVPVASTAILLAVRARLVREREALRVTAETDPLTGAANRRSLFNRIEYEITRHRRVRRSFTVLMLDLDGFKELNDRFGHAAGDDLLREVAAAIRTVIRDQDTVARIGGDEFCVLAPETDLVGAEKLLARVMSAVERVTAGIDALSASPGVAVFPQDGGSTKSLLQTADEQLINVKRSRRTARTRRRAA